MNTQMKHHKCLSALIFVLGLFACTASNAWYGGGGYYHGGYYRGGGYYHGGYGGGYYRGGYYRGGYYGVGGAGVIVGVPIGRYYYGPRCTIVQQCYNNGSCVERRICN